MQALIITNSIAILAIAAYLLRSFASRLELRIERTFFEEKPHGIRLTVWEHPRWSTTVNAGTGRVLRWANPNRLSDTVEGKRQNRAAHDGKLIPQGILATVWEGLLGKAR